MQDQKGSGWHKLLIDVDGRLFALIKNNYRRLGYSTLVSFIRAAVAEKLRRDGIDVPVEYELARPKA